MGDVGDMRLKRSLELNVMPIDCQRLYSSEESCSRNRGFMEAKNNFLALGLI